MITSLRVTTTPATKVNTTAALLACGAVAGPLFLVVVFIQAFTRRGFSMTIHPPSLLSLGDGGWIQVANFIVCGLLFVAAGAGLRRATRATWGPILIACVGAGMVIGGLFSADPGLGFPAGAPAGQPTTMTWHAMLHLTGFGIGYSALVAACFVYARRYWYSAIVGGVTALCFVYVMSGLSHGNLIPLWLALVVGWTWISIIPARQLARENRV
ncbi:MAG: DUF998 domain-containing protein [Chloroflexi bacterium]|nr:MAG: DUF998 domain-containing protein [Chloroflexota bacterium]TMF81581.1 MAG: DUF998 domain-containing protein [Chloroflexota bacterium]TMG10716.1 MAG: DUF998 domain-containing protein [Chloroflexota bacterium]